jgi:Holliday junction resolvasome RuvABC endonuclease subunit
LLVLGLDPQRTRLGYGVVSTDGEVIRPLGCGVDHPALLEPLGEFIRRALGELRGGWLAGISVVYVEAPHVGASRRIAVDHAMVVGRVLQEAERTFAGAPVELLQPSEWRRLCGLSGGATKAQVMAWSQAYGFDPDGMQDAADAACVAVAGAVRNAEIVRYEDAERLKPSGRSATPRRR